MKAKDKVRKDTISFVRAAIKQVEVDTREEVDDQGSQPFWPSRSR